MKVPFLLPLVSLFYVFHQAEAQVHSDQQYKHKSTSADSINDLNHFFAKGHFHGHARSYFMATDNAGSLTDFYALGVGAGIGYETPRILKRFQFGLSGFFMFNLLSSDLAKPDPKTGQFNRYEVGLFDIRRPNDHEDLDRLEELYLRYHFGKKSKITVGRQVPKMPFINPQDGRMRPTLTEAAVVELNEWKNTKVQLEYVFRISPRSTVEWFRVGESIGIYPVGVGLEGKPSAYANNIESKGILVGGITHTLGPVTVQAWDTYVENVFNTAFVQVDWKSKFKNKHAWVAGFQAVRQQSVGEGGNHDVTKAYMAPDSRSAVFSGRIGYRSPKYDVNINATRITAEGRYLMPREWGREPFYTFMPRERNEGMGDVNAFSVNAFYKPRTQLKWEVSWGYYKLSDVKNVFLNKYGMPAYTQLNAGMSYQFKGFFEGLDAQLLVVRKDNIGATYDNDRYVFNKVNMSHFNFILNYHY
ncbi:OprD family outer membrane porin [Runella limosa]|uniref:OprD family outer membrane porin n=1 Tax=Runella limosa TaxID=370978 RepID=UPI0004083031|nr:OprD family outer membrane porin [Runella limosa]